MKIFNPVNQEYISPIDLNVYNNYRTTRHQGHIQAIQSVSAAKTAIAKLDLNEAESAYRQQLSDKIDYALQSNTIAGNSFEALDDIILEQSNIMNDQGLLGRLNAQKDYKDYLKKLETAKIPEEYKNYYRNKNKYYYNDKFDDNGNVIQGDAWKPQEDYVDSIDPQKVMSAALKDVAKSAGGNEVVNQDGQWLVKKGTRWEGLDPEKVRVAIENAINTTPGMKASLNQDWKIGVKEKYNELLKENGDVPFIDSRFTDSNGNLLNESKYVQNLIDNFVKTSSGINYINSVDYQHIPQYTGTGSGNSKGSGLTAEQATNARNIALSNSTNVGTYDLGTNTFENASKQAVTAGRSFGQILSKRGTIKGVNGGDVTPSMLMKYVKANNNGANVTGPGDALNQYFQMINPNTGRPYGENYTLAEKQLLYLGADAHYRANNGMKSIQDNLSYSNREALKFKQSLDRGYFEAGNSVYDDRVIRYNNLMFAEGDIPLSMPSEVYNEFLRMYNGVLPNYVSVSPELDGRRTITLLDSGRNASPLFAYNLIQANNNKAAALNPANIVSVLLNHRKRFRFDYEGDGNPNHKYEQLYELASIYENGQRAAERTVKEMNKPSTTRVDVSATMFDSETAAMNNYLMANGSIDSTEANRLNKMASENLDRAFANNNISAGRMFEIKDFGDGENSVFTQPEDGLKLQALVSYMYANEKPVSRLYGDFAGIIGTQNGANVSPTGYYLTFTVPKDYHDSDYREKHIRIFVSDTMDEGTGYNIGGTTAMQAKNSVRIAATTGNDYSVIPFNNYFGDTHIRALGDGKFEANFLGGKAIDDEGGMRAFTEALITIQQAKAMYQQNRQAYGDAAALALTENNFESSGIYNTLSYVYSGNTKYSDFIKSKVRQYLNDTSAE